jgi:hypothetical protein
MGTGTAPTNTRPRAANPKLGMILTDGNGATLYLFEKDTFDLLNGHTDWYPSTTSKRAPTAGPRATASMIATITLADGSTHRRGTRTPSPRTQPIRHGH